MVTKMFPVTFWKKKSFQMTLFPCTAKVTESNIFFKKFWWILSKLIFSNEWKVNTWFTFSYKIKKQLLCKYTVSSLWKLKLGLGFYYGSKQEFWFRILNRGYFLQEIHLKLATWKVSKHGVLSGPYFSLFGLNTENRKSPYSVRIQDNTDQKNLRIWTLFKHYLFLPR